MSNISATNKYQIIGINRKFQTVDSQTQQPAQKQAEAFGTDSFQKNNIAASLQLNLQSPEQIDYKEKITEIISLPSQQYSKLIDSVRGKVNKKDFVEGASYAIEGTGSILDTLEEADIEEVAPDFLRFISIAIRLSVKPGKMLEDYQNGDYYTFGRNTISLGKGVWGGTLSGLKTASAFVVMAKAMKIIKPETALKVMAREKKLSHFTSKVAIPFAIASTGLYAYDLATTRSQISDIKSEISQSTGEKKQELANRLAVLNKNSNYKTAAVVVSGLSTAAHVASVVRPASAVITTPVALGSSAVASVLRTLSKDKMRDIINQNYNSSKDTVNNISITDKYREAKNYLHKEILPTIYFDK